MNWPHIGTTLGALLVGYVALQLFVVALRAARRNIGAWRHLADDRAAFWKQVEELARQARVQHRLPDWEGWRSFRVAAIVDECRDVKSFYFTPVDGQPLARFAPGQHVTFRLPDDPQAPALIRCYSLSACPREDFYRCTIKRIPKLADMPSTRQAMGSHYFHDRVQVGDTLELRAPGGHFHLDPKATEAVALIGAGIGITPLVAMLDAIILSSVKRDVYVLFGFRNGETQPFKEHLQKLASTHANLHLQVCYTAPLETDVLHHDYHHRGRVTFDRVRELVPSSQQRFYVCGPSSMMNELVPALCAWGVRDEHVHFEAFGPSSARRNGASATARAPSEPCEVTFQRSDRSQRWDGAFENLLEFGEAAGVVMPSGCRAGSCGECMLAVHSGAVETIVTPGVSVPDGYCLPCISMPTSNLVLEA